MARNIIKYSAGILAATATTGALVLSSPGLAQAATFSQGQSDQEHSITNGTGDADARAKATDGGRLNVFTEADGGNATGPLPGTTSSPTTARASASLTKRVPVAEGSYRVVFTYQGLQGTETDRGSNANAQVVRDSIVRFVAQSGGEDRTVNRVQQVSSSKGTRSTELLINIPNNSSGYLRVRAILKAFSSANGAKNFAHGDAHASNITFKVNRV